jgi:NifU-like protein involved in Fe-S cluster formation
VSSRPPDYYSEKVLELFRTLPGAGTLPPGEGECACGEAAALDRGAWVRFEARVAGGRIDDCRFRAFGCPHTLAAAALAVRALRALPLERAQAIDAASLARELDAPREKLGRLLVVEDALRALLAEARRVQ